MAESFTVGFRTMAGIGAEATYGIEALVTEPLVIISESLTQTVELLQPPALDGRAQRRQGEAGNLTIAGDIVVPLRYGVGHPFWRYWFGTYNATTGTYTHAAVVSDSFTFALRKGATIWAFFGVTMNQLTLTAAPAGVTLTAAVTAKDFTTASAINTDAVIRRLIDPAPDIHYLHFLEADKQSSVWVGDQADALTVADKIKAGTLTLTLGRPKDQVQTNEGLEQPAENDYPPVTLALAIPHHTSNVFQGWNRLKTRLQARFRFVHPRTGEFKLIQLPNVQVQTAPVNISGPGAPTQNVTVVASESEETLTSTGISFAASDNSINISSAAGTAATRTLTLTGVSSDGETITIGGRIYEIDTQTFPGSVTQGHVPVAAANTKASQTLTIDTQPTAADTFTIGSTVYTMVATGTADAAGEVNIGASLAVTQANIVKAVNGTDGLNTAHPTVTIAPFSSNIATVTAKAGGTGGNAIATTETFTAGSNVFGGSTLAGGVSPTADQTVTALVTAINADAAAEVTAADGAGSTVDITAKTVGVIGNSIALAETLANGAWAGTTMTGGVDAVALPYCVAGADIWIEGSLAGSGVNNGVAPVVSRTTTKIIIANASNGGITLVNEAAGASVTITTRSPDIIMSETPAA